MKEGADGLRMAAQAADDEADSLLQHVEIGRAESAQGMLFQPGPEPLIGIESRSMSGQAIHPQALAIVTQCCTSTPRAMQVTTARNWEGGFRGLGLQVFDETDDFVAGDRAGDQMQVGVWVGRHGGDGRKLRPVEAVAQNGGLPARGPSAAGGGQERKPAFVHENQDGFQALGFFFKRGQVCCTQRWMAASSRSRARPVGFCQLQPNRCSRRQT